MKSEEEIAEAPPEQISSLPVYDGTIVHPSRAQYAIFIIGEAGKDLVRFAID